MQRSDLLVWMDLEMTSLNVRTDQIIEIAAILTDKDLQIVAEGPNLVIHADSAVWGSATEFNLKMHTDNGLRSETEKSTLSLAAAEEQMLEFLKTHVAPQTAPLCGNSIHVDRHFLKMQMPTLEHHLFYRCIDVSTIKQLTQFWAPELYRKAEELKKVKAHRAKDDILQSIEELRFYREKLFTSR